MVETTKNNISLEDAVILESKKEAVFIPYAMDNTAFLKYLGQYYIKDMNKKYYRRL